MSWHSYNRLEWLFLLSPWTQITLKHGTLGSRSLEVMLLFFVTIHHNKRSQQHTDKREDINLLSPPEMLPPAECLEWSHCCVRITNAILLKNKIKIPPTGWTPLVGTSVHLDGPASQYKQLLFYRGCQVLQSWNSCLDLFGSQVPGQQRREKEVAKIGNPRVKYQLPHHYSINIHLFYYCLLINKS